MNSSSHPPVESNRWLFIRRIADTCPIFAERDITTYVTSLTDRKANDYDSLKTGTLDQTNKDNVKLWTDGLIKLSETIEQATPAMRDFIGKNLVKKVKMSLKNLKSRPAREAAAGGGDNDDDDK